MVLVNAPSLVDLHQLPSCCAGASRRVVLIYVNRIERLSRNSESTVKGYAALCFRDPYRTSDAAWLGETIGAVFARVARPRCTGEALHVSCENIRDSLRRTHIGRPDRS